MAYDVEDKVVQMRFDNSDFDPNIDASVKSLEKLEKSLQLANGTTGLENVNKAAKNMDFSPIIAGVEQISGRFSAMEIVAISTISNITNRFVNMGANILKQLFIAPLSTGWAEYGQQMDSTQIIMANTGESIERVTQSLNDLNEYADLTVYSFGQMTNAIGKFAAAGVDLDSATTAIKGLSNAAAIVGASNTNIASAYYNLSQALQVGALTAIDWRPLQYSMIGTRSMQKVFIETAIAMGKFTKDSEQAQKAYSNFKDSLSSKWLDKDVIVEGLKVYSLNIKELTEKVDEATGEIYYLNKEGEKIPKWMVDLGTSATRAATEVKSLTQLWDVLREEAQTGWADNWKIIIGDLNQAKELWTNVSNRITGIIGTINDAMSNLIKGFVDLGGRDTLISALMQVLNNLRMSLIPFFRILDTIINISSESLKKFADELLNTAESFYLSKEQGEALFQVLKVLTIPIKIFLRFNMLLLKSIRFVIEVAVESAKLILNIISSFNDGFVGILRLLGLTEDEIQNVLNIGKNVRTIIIKTTDIIFRAVARIFRALAPGIAVILKSITLIINVVSEIISILADSDFEWFANILYTVSIVLNSIFAVISTIVSSIHDAMDSGLGEFLNSTSKILLFLATLLSRILVLATYFISNVIEKLSPLLGAVGNLLLSVANALFSIIDGLFNLKSEDANKFFNSIVKGLTIAIQYLSLFIDKIASVINGIAGMINSKNWKEVGSTIVSSFTKGFKGAVPVASKAVTEFGDTVTEDVRDTLQVHSPSPLFIEIGSWIPKSISKGIDSTANVVEKSADNILTGLSKIFSKKTVDESAQKQLDSLNNSLTKFLDTINETVYFRLAIIAVALVGTLALLYLVIKKAGAFSEFFEMFGDIGESFKIKAIGELLKDFAISIGILAAAIVAMVAAFKLSKDDKIFYKVIGVLASIAILVTAISAISAKLSKDVQSIYSFSKVMLHIDGIILALSVFISALSLLGNKNIDGKIIGILGTVSGILIALYMLSFIMSKNLEKDTLRKMQTNLLTMSMVILSLSFMIKSLSKIANSNYDTNVNWILLELTGTITLLSALAANLVKTKAKIKTALSGIPLIISITASITVLVNQLNRIANSNFDTNVNLTLLTLAGTVSLLSTLAAKIVKTKAKIKTALSGALIISVITASLASLCVSLSKLGNTAYDPVVNVTLLTLLVTIATLSTLATIIVDGTEDIKNSLIGLVVIATMTGLVIALANQLKNLDNLNISWKIIAQLAVIEALVLAMAAIGIAIGHGSYYVAIGTAAIIGISAALLIAAHALKVFSSSDMDNLVNGFIKFRDAMTGGKNFGKVVLLAVGLIFLSIAIALIAPGIDLLAIAAVLFSVAMDKMSKAIHKIIADINSLAESIKNSRVAETSSSFLIFLTKYLGTASENITKLAKSLAKLGAAFAILGVGALIALPLMTAIIGSITMLFNGLNQLINNLYKVKNFLLALADHADNINKVLSSLSKNITGLKIALTGITVLSAFDRGRTPARIIVALAKAFSIASVGALLFGISLKQIAIGITLMSLAINIAKQLIGDELASLMDKLKTRMQALIDKFGLFGAVLITFVRNMTNIAALDAISAWLWILGKRLQSFGMGLIQVSIGAILFAFAMKKIAEGLNYIAETNAFNVIGGIVVAVMALNSVAYMLGGQSSNLKKAAKGIKAISGALIIMSGALIALSYSMNLARNYVDSIYAIFVIITEFSTVMGIVAPLAVAAGVAIGTLGASLTLLDIGLVGLVGVLILLKNTLGGISTLWEFYGFLTAFSATMGVLSIPTVLAGVAIGTLAAGLFALSLALLALSGSLAVFSKVVTESDFLRAFFIEMAESIKNTIETVKKYILYGILGIVDFITKFVENLKVGIPVIFEEIGWWIPESLKNGLLSGVDSVLSAAATIGNTIMNTIRDILDVHSESPTGNEIGWWESVSIAHGIESGLGAVGKAAGKVGTTFWEGLDAGTNGKAKGWLNDLKKSIGTKANSLKDWIQNDLFNFGEGGLFGGIADALGGEGLSGIFDVFQELDKVNFEVPDFSEYANGISNVADSASSAKGTIGSLTDTLKNQMKIFEKFASDEEILNPKELINNMKSQLRGMQNWANGIDQLAVRGMSGPLLQYLSEMGPEGYKYVEAFLEMTESEFSEANKLYSDSLEMPSKTANQIGESYKRAGVEIVEAVASGMSSGSGAIDDAGKDIDKKVTDNVDWTARRSKKISIDGVTTTQGTIADLVAKYGPDTALTYVKELDKWMDSDQFRVYAASVQGKVGAIFQFNTNQLSDALKNVTYVMDKETLVTGETAKKLKANTQTILSYVVDGVKKTTNASEYMKACEKAGYMIGAEILNGSRRSLGINSPSKEYEDVAKFSVLGLVRGIDKYSKEATKASSELGTDTVESISETIKAVSATFTDDLDTTPTIRPVLDLSNVYDGMGQLDTLFSTNQARIAASAYATNRSADDGINRLQQVINASNDKMARDIVDAIQNSDQPVTVNVTLQGGAEQFFDFVVDQNRQEVLTKGTSPLMIMRRNSINASLA